MPTTTPIWGIVIPASDLEAADLFGVATRLGLSVETALSLTDSATLASDAVATSTSNVTFDSSANLTISSPSVNAKFEIELFADVHIGGTAGTNIIECLVDGVVQGAQLVTAGPAGLRVSGSKLWIVTGLSEGDHPVTFRTRNETAVTVTIHSGQTVARLRPTG